MNHFVYEMPVKVYFGENGVEKHLGNELSNYGPTIMLAYGKGSIKKNRKNMDFQIIRSGFYGFLLPEFYMM